jgi:hypothetical protein
MLVLRHAARISEGVGSFFQFCRQQAIKDTCVGVDARRLKKLMPPGQDKPVEIGRADLLAQGPYGVIGSWALADRR